MPRLPGRGKKTKQQKEQEQLQSVTGMLREMDDKFVVIEAKDTRLISLKRSASTKFLKNGEDMKSELLKPGDHMMIEYTQDDQGYVTAVNVNLEKEGTEQERERASAPVDVAIQEARAANANGEDERPVQRRRDAAGEADSRSDASAEPAKQSAPAKDTPAKPPAPPVSQPASQAPSSKPAATTATSGPPEAP